MEETQEQYTYLDLARICGVCACVHAHVYIYSRAKHRFYAMTYKSLYNSELI